VGLFGAIDGRELACSRLRAAIHSSREASVEMNISRDALFMVAGMIAIVRLLPALDGWHFLAARYPAGKRAGGKVFRPVPARVRGMVVYASVLATPAGLGIRVWLPWHPPIFIPWSEMVHCVPAGLFREAPGSSAATRRVCPSI
jgi:hypothetical protein